jgi:ribose transport system substrate-binding protein
MPGVADPFYYTMEKGIRAKAKELGVNVVVGDYPDSWGPEKQVPNLQALMAKGGIDLLLIAPTSTTALVAPLKAIKDKGIAVITVDTYLGDGDYSKASDYSFPLAYIGTDNKLGGKQVAEHLAKLIGEKGKVYVVNTNPDVSSVKDRGDGFKEGIAEFPNVKLVGMDYCLDNQQKAAELTTAALQKNPDIVGIFGVNVFSAQGAAQAVKNAGLAGAVKVASWDATQTLIDALKGGDIDLVLAQLPAEIGSLGIDAGYKYLSAKTMPPKKIIPGFQFFTKDNVNNADMQQYVYSK